MINCQWNVECITIKTDKVITISYEISYLEISSNLRRDRLQLFHLFIIACEKYKNASIRYNFSAGEFAK